MSTDEQAVLEFNSLQAQEQICKTYISMRSDDPAAKERWVASETYSDPGYSGGTLERPALKRLLADIEAGRVDTIIIYKIDRLSRSIHQFYRIWEVLQHHGVDLISATQDLNTSTSQGKLMLNMLLSFGQFEREQISERTRDKIAAARRTGRWTGGMPILGYDVVPRGGRLAVNKDEATMVQEIFRLYLATPSLTKVIEELGRRGWRRKTWTLRSGVVRNGAAFDKLGLLHLLRNPLYIGKVPHHGTLHPGQHDAIVPVQTWESVQDCLTRNGRDGYQGERENSGALLRGLLHCAQCGSAMTPTYTMKSNTRYRYYRCMTTIKMGAHACQCRAVPAHEIEARFVDRIRAIGRDPALVAETVEQVRRQRDELIARLGAEGRALAKELRAKKAALTRVKMQQPHGDGAHLNQQDTRIREIAARLEVIPGEIKTARRTSIGEDDIRSALEAFGPVWGSLWPTERARILRVLIERINYDGRDENFDIRFRSGEPNALADDGTA